MLRSLLAASSVALLLAACVPPQPTAAPAPVPTKTQKHARVAKSKPAAKPAPKPVVIPQADSLIGRNVSTTRDLLGKPLMVRRERGAALWLYSAGRCNAHILTNATNRGEIVRDLQFRDSKTQRSFAHDSDAGRYCFKQIVEAKRTS